MNEWTDDMNDQPYRGRRSDSRKRKSSSKKKSGGSGKGTRGQVAIAAFLFLMMPGGFVAGVALYLLHGYGVI